jgi:hypothetical protein
MSGLTRARLPLSPEPLVFPSYTTRRFIHQILSLFTPKGLPTLPKWLQYFLLSLLVINIKSFPLLWHIRMLYNILVPRAIARPSVHPLLFWIRSNNVITTSPGVVPVLRLDSIPIGKDIFEDKDTHLHR